MPGGVRGDWQLAIFLISITVLPHSSLGSDLSCPLYYEPDDTNTSCEICPAVTAFESCPLNSTSPAGSMYKINCTCDFGFGYDGAFNWSCVQCAPGQYYVVDLSVPGGSRCEACPVNTYSSTFGVDSCSQCPGNSSTSGATGSDNKTKCACDAGYHSDGESAWGCVQCPAGTYSEVDTSVLGQKVCTNCPVDKYSTSVGASSSATCQSCDSTTTSEAGSDASTDCKCKLGHYGSDGGPCTVCAVGSYSDTVGKAACDLCTDSYANTTTASTTSTSSTACVCIAGYYDNADRDCQPCEIGKYKDAIGSVACTNCGSNFYTAETGSDSFDLCLCNANYYKSGSSCQTCNSNQQSLPGSSSNTDCKCNTGYTGSDGSICTACGTGKYKDAIGSAACSDCTSNSNSVAASSSVSDCKCNAGYSGDIQSTSDVCTACAAGSYKTTSGTADCTLCPKGKFSTATASTTDPCTVCAQDTYADSTGTSACTHCFDNSVITDNAATVTQHDSQDDCKCNKGYISSNSSFYCQSCDPGYFKGVISSISNSQNETCSGCSAGKYSDVSATTSCTQCTPNSYSPLLSNNIVNCTCNKGYTGADGGPCASCVAGTYKNITGASPCSPCPNNTYSTAPAKTDSTCAACPQNTVSNQGSGIITACKCDLGYTGNDGVACDACTSGKYKSAIGSAACSNCPANTFTNLALAATECSQCPQHSTSSDASNSIDDCICDDGYYRKNETLPSFSCQICPRGSYCSMNMKYQCTANSTSNEGSSRYEDCSCLAGYFYDGSPGQHDCDECTATFYCPGGDLNNRSDPGSRISCGPNATSPVKSQSELQCECLPNYKNSEEEPSNPIKCTACDLQVENCPGGRGEGVACPANARVLFPLKIGIESCGCSPGFYSLSPMTNETSTVGETPCILCEAGYYCTGGTAREQCYNNSHANEGSGSITACSCNSGYYGEPGTTCTACEENHWCAAGIRNECPDLSSSPVLSDNVTDCVCNPGAYGLLDWSIHQFNATGACKYCGEGYYCGGGESRLQCPDNTETADKNSSVITECICSLGYEGVDGEACSACSMGYYKDYKGQGNCTPCGLNTYLDSIAATQASECTLCPDNSHSPIGSPSRFNCTCDLGHTGPDGEACTACPAGTFKDVNGSSPCTLCKNDTYSTAVAAVSNSTCESCPLHTLSPQGSNELTDCICLKGFYASSDGVECTACEPGRYKPEIGASAFALPQAACFNCPQGTFMPNTAATACIDCPTKAFATSPEESTASVNCSCKAGYSGVNGGTCTPCRPGKYKEVAGDHPCLTCGAATFSDQDASTSCTSCPPFSSSNPGSTGDFACVCANGFHGDYQTGCSVCPFRSVCFGGDQESCDPTLYSTTGSYLQQDCRCLYDICKELQTLQTTFVVEYRDETGLIVGGVAHNPVLRVRKAVKYFFDLSHASNSFCPMSVSDASIVTESQSSGFFMTASSPGVYGYQCSNAAGVLEVYDCDSPDPAECSSYDRATCGCV